ncbi:MAG TPA: ABC transporter ATP-binding protein [Egibacteraceae bacterium]|nr:ABC transporter ATP-binding protein [Egibacteraceae bacterium]
MQPAIEVRGLVKTYGGQRVVDGLSFDVPAGAIFALLGPNGAGKTTTVECIEGFRIPDAGAVRVLGRDPRRQRQAVVGTLGVMLQEGGAYQAATPAEMARLHASFYPNPVDVPGLLADVGLAGVAQQRYRSLSGGQKQRLNLALALVGRPEVVILDEPTAGMDPQARLATWDMLRGLRERGVTVLLTTHFMDEAERLSDTVAVIDQGRVLALDSPAELVGRMHSPRLLVTTARDLDVAEVAAGLGAQVSADGAGRYLIAAGPESIARVSAWFAASGIPITGVTTARGGLEEVFLQLTGRRVRE